MSEWEPIITAPEGVLIETKIHPPRESPRNVQKLVRKKSMFWLKDMSMYVYYKPTHWRAF